MGFMELQPVRVAEWAEEMGRHGKCREFGMVNGQYECGMGPEDVNAEWE